MKSTKKSIAIILASVVLIPFIVKGQTINTPQEASMLNLACVSSSASEYSRGFCDGSIEAIYSMMDGWCVPPEVTHGEVKTIVRNGLMINANVGAAAPVVIRIIQETWPC